MIKGRVMDPSDWESCPEHWFLSIGLNGPSSPDQICPKILSMDRAYRGYSTLGLKINKKNNP